MREELNVEELFASKVFTLGKMKERLPKSTYKEVKKVMDHEMKNLCKQNWYQITLLFLFCVTVFLRFYKLTVLPDVLHIDEAALGYNSWCLANYGTDRYLNVLPFYPQNFYGGQSPLYTYLVVLLIKFFGKGNLSVFLVRFPAAFAQMYGIPE
jgi:hypothetical protein